MPRSDMTEMGSEQTVSVSPSGLTDELARRLTVSDQAEQPLSTEPLEPPKLFSEARHGCSDSLEQPQGQLIDQSAKRRQKDRLKTTAVALVMCLNIGVDPPDVIKISPCARLECWVDPMSMQGPKALDTIGNALQAQYERWQPRAKYKKHLDPTIDDVKKLAVSCRRLAKNERVLFHYNGHGVPRPTVNGEVWVFNKSYTQYIPMSIYDLQSWVGSPCIYVLDCSAAGLLVNSFRSFAEQRAQELEAYADSAAGASGYPPPEDVMHDCILLGTCGPNEVLPQSPELPADIFTACLTTPIRVALRWFCSRSLLRSQGLSVELVDRIPGKQTDRKTPLGELNWIFTAITDTIAWNLLPRALFQRLFRQDLLVASLFRNFLLAERIMRAVSCTPVSLPRLPPSHQHPMWNAWDMAAELCLLQLPGLLGSEGAVEFQPSPFFSQQLTAFELWLQHGSRDRKPPEQLPIVLQVLLSQVHRLRALVLLGRFLDMGAWAVDLALSVGIFPYVLKLLQTTAADLRPTLVFIWTKILACDHSCQADLIKDNGHNYFIKFLEAPDAGTTAETRAQAAFVLATICHGCDPGRTNYRAHQITCHNAGLLQVLISNLMTSGELNGAASSALLIKWLCLCLGRFCEDSPDLAAAALELDAMHMLPVLLSRAEPELRAAAAFALTCLIQVDGEQSAQPSTGQVELEREIACCLLQVMYDGSPLVRAEAAVGIARLVASPAHSVLFQDAVQEQQREGRRIQARMVTRPQQQQQQQDAAHSAPAHHTSRLAHATRAASVDLQFPDRTDSQPMPNGVTHNHASPSMPSSPEARAASLGYERMPVLSIPGRSASISPDSPAGVSGGSGGDAVVGGSPSNGSIYASADAARVGEGLYPQLVEAACLLATDAFPRVARLGKALLHVADVELLPQVVTPAAQSSRKSLERPGGSLGSLPEAWAQRAQSVASALSYSSLPELSAAPAETLPGPSLGRLGGSNSPPDSIPKAPGSSSRWRSWRPLASAAGSAASSPAEPSSPDASASHPPGTPRSIDMQFTRPLLTLKQVGRRKAQQQPQGQAARQQQQQPPQASQPLQDGAPQAAQQIPPSYLWEMSCHHLALPLLDPQDVNTGKAGEPRPPDFGQASPGRTSRRMAQRHDALQSYRDRTEGYSLEQRCLSEMRQPSDRSTAAIAWHPFRADIITADTLGFVQTTKFSRFMQKHDEDRLSESIVLGDQNCFHVTNGAAPDAAAAAAKASPAAITKLMHLNEVHAAVLLAGCADGSVRVWRNHTFYSQQRLSTAFQAVPVTGGAVLGGPIARAVYAGSERWGSLLASGGTAPLHVHMWSLLAEQCVQQFEVRAPAGACISHLAASNQTAHVVAATTDGHAHLIDPRASNGTAASLQLHAAPLVDMALEPGAQPHLLVSGCSHDNKLALTDLRMLSQQQQQSRALGGAEAGCSPVWKMVSTDLRGKLTALTAHACAPLIAAGSSHQMVKLWNIRGEEQGVPIRIHTHLLAARPGPLSRLAFHPHRLQLAVATEDPFMTLFEVNHPHLGSEAPSSVALSHPSPAPSASPSAALGF